MNFFWFLWRKEIKASLLRFLFVMFCAGLGVGGLATVRAFSHTIQNTVNQEARSLLAADISLRKTRPFTAAEKREVKRLQQAGARVVQGIRFLSLVQRLDANGKPLAARLAGVRGVQAGYPLYGRVITASGKPLSQLLTKGHALVEESLLYQLDAKVGDTLRLGKVELKIADVLIREPDATVQFSRFAPRLLMGFEEAQASGLIGPASRVVRNTLIRLPKTQDPHQQADSLRKALPNRFSTIRTYDQAQPFFRRIKRTLEDYLNLIGLAALLLSGVGIAGAVRVHTLRSANPYALYRCLGAPTRTLLGVHVMTVGFFGILGGILGGIIGGLAQQVLNLWLGELLPVKLVFAWTPRLLIPPVVMGAVVAVWFSLAALWRLGQTPPVQTLRRDIAHEGVRGLFRLPEALTSFAMSIAFACVMVWLTVGFNTLSLIFIGALAAAMVLCPLIGLGLIALIRGLPSAWPFIVRQGVACLHRPGNQTLTIIASIGLGGLVLFTALLLRNDLLHQLTPSKEVDQPNVFMVDIQPSQRETFRLLAKKHGLGNANLTPIVRGRIKAVKGERVKPNEIENSDALRYLRFEYAMTYRDALGQDEKLLKGTFAHDPSILGPQVSVTQWLVDHGKFGIGDTITMDIQGVHVKATITSIRRVNWRSRRANYSLVFLPGALEEAPKIYLAEAFLPTAQAKANLRRDLVKTLPNVSMLDIESILKTLNLVLDRAAAALRFMAVFLLIIGLSILFSAILASRVVRLKEVGLWRALGSSQQTILQITAVEQGILGLAAGAVTVMGANVLAWALLRFVFHFNFHFSWEHSMLAWGITILSTTAGGVLCSWPTLRGTPLSVLKEE